jgi:SAM-dependent methyltransferase
LTGDQLSSVGNLKFLNFTHYARNKMAQVRRLGLHQGPPKRILDIGCGPGHFQLIAKYFGHEAVGLDLPVSPDHVFNGLREFFEISKIDHRITAMQPLPAFSERFDLVTVFLTQFDFYEKDRPWDAAPWRFFVDNICDTLLKPKGTLYFTLTSSPRPPDVLQYLESVSDRIRNDRAVLIRRDRKRNPLANIAAELRRASARILRPERAVQSRAA